jgi:protein O-mannosyl-transferase
VKSRRNAALFVLLAVPVCAVFGRAVAFPFVNFDDNTYVYDNPFVAQGLSLEALGWALTTTRGGIWHPLTWLSHLLDVELFGLRPWGHHLVSVLLHALNAGLLFVVLRRLTGARWRSWLVAALFALHPLRVQSVAWVSERKDLLSALLGLTALLLYLRYARRPSRGGYLALAAVFALGLAAKPMLVTLPLLLLLLDWWPLGRFSFRASAAGRGPGPAALLREKAALLAIAVLFGIVSIHAQRSVGALMDLDAYPLAGRVANALVATAGYLGKLLFPANLAVFYPLRPGGAVWPAAAGALAALAGITAVAAREARRRPYLLAGWLWYLATLLPVSGLIQVGHQAMADRYTYLPLIGLQLAAVWALAEISRRRPRLRAALVVAAAAVLPALAAASWREVGHWRDSEHLMRRALAVTRDNFTAHNNLATALMTQARYDEAVPHLEAALRIRPDHFNAHLNLGQILLMRGRAREAAALFAEAARLDPGSADARRLLAQAQAALDTTRRAGGH